MTEYDYSPEAYERFMATQTRISNWIDNVSQSMQTPSPSSRHSYDHPHHPPHHQHHSQQQQQQQQQSQYHQPQRHSSRHIYSQSYPQQQQQPQQHTHSNSHSQTHSRTNSLSRRSSRTRQQSHYQDPSRPRSYSQTGGRPQAVHTHTAPIPPPPPPPPQMHSRTYSYAMNNLPPPLVPGGPIPVPQQVPYPHLAPRRSRTLPPQTQNVVYHTYDAPRGGPTYVMVPPVFGGAPHGQQYRMQSSPMAPKRPHQPLLKRLFTSFGPWGSSSGSSPKGKFAPRRHPRRSSF